MVAIQRLCDFDLVEGYGCFLRFRAFHFEFELEIVASCIRNVSTDRGLHFPLIACLWSMQPGKRLDTTYDAAETVQRSDIREDPLGDLK